MSDSDPIFVIQGLASTTGIVKDRLHKLVSELVTDPEAVAALLARWDADTLSQAAQLIDKETAVKVVEALAEVRFESEE